MIWYFLDNLTSVLLLVPLHLSSVNFINIEQQYLKVATFHSLLCFNLIPYIFPLFQHVNVLSCWKMMQMSLEITAFFSIIVDYMNSHWNTWRSTEIWRYYYDPLQCICECDCFSMLTEWGVYHSIFAELIYARIIIIKLS